MQYLIKPFKSVGYLNFDEERNKINSKIDSEFSSTENEDVISGEKSTNDYYNELGLILGYSNQKFKLEYIVFSDPCELIFEDKDLLNLNYKECYEFLKQFDNEIEEENYVGFFSYKLGIAVYAPNAIKNSNSQIECITVGNKGYLESL